MSYTESGPLVLVPQRALLDASSADVELTLAEPGSEMMGKLIAAIAIDLEHTASISYSDSSGAQVHVFGEVGEAVWFYGATLSAWLKLSEGDVLGPASATNNELVRFDGTTGKLIQGGSGVSVTDSGFLSGLGPITMDEVFAVLNPSAGQGTFWIKSDTPNTPRFTDDAGGTHELLPGLVGYSIATSSSTGVTTATIPVDNTLPQSSEGAQIIAVTHTPKSTSNKLLVFGKVFAGHTYATTLTATVALFKDLASSAVAAEAHSTNQYGVGPFVVLYEETATSTSAQTWKLRGGATGGSFRWNGSPFAGTGLYSTAIKTVLMVLELKP